MINDGVVVEAVYGSFPMAIWNGGRVISGEYTNAMMAENIINYFNNRGISCRYTFTNCLLEEKHLDDTWCNTLLKIGDNGINAVIVNSDLLNNYIREKYPNYPRISSITKVIRSIEEFNTECERDFSVCVLLCDFNNRFDELAKIKCPQKAEILVNEYCIPNCTLREEHYAAYSEAQLNFRDSSDFNKCPARTNFINTKDRPHFISYQDIVEKYAPMGFKHFKINGRTLYKKETLIGAYLEYFIKPEWHVTARLLLEN